MFQPVITIPSIDDVPAIAAVNFQAWNETYRGLIDDAFLNSLTLPFYEKKWRGIFKQAGNDWVARVIKNEEGTIVGYITGGKGRQSFHNCEGEIYSLYLLKAYHGKKYGSALFREGARQLQQKGFNSFYVFVLKQNPALAFYRHYRPHVEDYAKVKIDEREYDDIGLGWNNFDFLNA